MWMRLAGADAEQLASSILLLIGNRRFCGAVAAEAPELAIAIFQEMGRTRKRRLPIGQFSKNISSEAISNHQSLLHHEDSGWESGALGYWKPFSAAVYGNYDVVEGLSQDHASPLDIGYFGMREWSSEEFEVYTRAVLITFEAYLAANPWGVHSFAIAQAFGKISETAGQHNWALSQTDSAGKVDETAAEKLRIGVRFVERAIEAIEKLNPIPDPVSRQIDPQRRQGWDMYDELAMLAYSLFEGASWVRSDASSWSIQHNVFWTSLFSFTRRGKASRIIQKKVIRLIIAEINGPLFTYVTTRVFGMAINVVGFNKWIGEDHVAAMLRRFVRRWARKNLVRLYDFNAELVEAGLPANWKIHRRTMRLYRTYARGLEPKPKVVYLQLDPPH